MSRCLAGFLKLLHMEGQLQLQIGELSLSQKNEFLLEKLKLLKHSPSREESVYFLTKNVNI